jgi:hypothetical protein
MVAWMKLERTDTHRYKIDGFAMTIVAATNSGGGVLGSGSVIIPN